MQSPVTERQPASRVLIVAVADQELNPALLDAVRDRAAAGADHFHLVLPDPARHAELTARERQTNHERGEQRLRIALPRLSEAAGCDVTGSVSVRHDPMDAIEDVLRLEPFGEILLATEHHAVAERLHLDLPRRVAHLGLPVTTVHGEAASG
jgi:hypothetical protein